MNCIYEVERTRLLQLLMQVGLASSVVSLAEKYHDFPTLMSVCESAAEPRKLEMLHDYMIHFVNEVRDEVRCRHDFQFMIFKGFCKICISKIQGARCVGQC